MCGYLPSFFSKTLTVLEDRESGKLFLTQYKNMSLLGLHNKLITVKEAASMCD